MPKEDIKRFGSKEQKIESVGLTQVEVLVFKSCPNDSRLKVTPVLSVRVLNLLLHFWNIDFLL